MKKIKYGKNYLLNSFVDEGTGSFFFAREEMFRISLARLLTAGDTKHIRVATSENHTTYNLTGRIKILYLLLQFTNFN